MAKTSAIEWTDATWNPWMGCAKVSAGCKNCYMFRDQKRFGHDPTVLRRSKTTFKDPLKWKESKRIFVCSWSDFFWDEVDPLWRNEAWQVMREAEQHQFLILTKRPENIRSMLPLELDSETGWPYKNVWLGISAEDQANYDYRIIRLITIPAVVHFVSAEPLLGPINLGFLGIIPKVIMTRYTPMGQIINWVITGGESDLSNPRPMKLEWAKDIRDQCLEADVAFFHKQHGGTSKIAGAWGGRSINGVTHNEFPMTREGEWYR